MIDELPEGFPASMPIAMALAPFSFEEILTHLRQHRCPKGLICAAVQAGSSDECMNISTFIGGKKETLSELYIAIQEQVGKKVYND